MNSLLPARTSPWPPDLLGADSELHTSVLEPLLMTSVGPLDTTTGPPKSEGRNETEWEGGHGIVRGDQNTRCPTTWYPTTMSRMQFILQRLDVSISGLLLLSDPMSHQ